MDIGGLYSRIRDVVWVCFLVTFLPYECNCKALNKTLQMPSTLRNIPVYNIANDSVVMHDKKNVNNFDTQNTDKSAGVLSEKDQNVTVTEKSMLTTPKPEEKSEFPLAIIVASPLVAIGIVVFICITYRWHSMQLDAQAKDVAVKVAEGVCTSPCMPCTPCRTTRASPSGELPEAESELLGARKKIPRATTPPPSMSGKRGSSWSALSEELIPHPSSPRRHSAFVL